MSPSGTSHPHTVRSPRAAATRIVAVLGALAVGLGLAATPAAAVQVVRVETNMGAFEMALFSGIRRQGDAQGLSLDLATDGLIARRSSAMEGQIVTGTDNSAVRFQGFALSEQERINFALFGLPGNHPHVFPYVRNRRGSVALSPRVGGPLRTATRNQVGRDFSPPLCLLGLVTDWLINTSDNGTRDAVAGRPLIDSDTGEQVIDSELGFPHWVKCGKRPGVNAETGEPVELDAPGTMVIGQVLGDGMDVVDAIAALPTETMLRTLPGEKEVEGGGTKPVESDFLLTSNEIFIFPFVPLTESLEADPAGYGCLSVVEPGPEGQVGLEDDCIDRAGREEARELLRKDLKQQIRESVVRIESAVLQPVMVGPDRLKLEGLETVSGPVKTGRSVRPRGPRGEGFIEWRFDIADDGSWQVLDVTPFIDRGATTSRGIALELREIGFGGTSEPIDGDPNRRLLTPDAAGEAAMLRSIEASVERMVLRQIKDEDLDPTSIDPAAGDDYDPPEVTASLSFVKPPKLRAEKATRGGFAAVKGKLKVEGDVSWRAIGPGGVEVSGSQSATGKYRFVLVGQVASANE